MEKYNDPTATYRLGCFHDMGKNGLSVDKVKAFELYQRASELGSVEAHYNLGVMYTKGGAVEMDEKKAIHHWQHAAMMGHHTARYNLGALEGINGNHDLAMKHFMIAAECGDDESLRMVKKGFEKGHVTKEDF